MGSKCRAAATPAFMAGPTGSVATPLQWSGCSGSRHLSSLVGNRSLNETDHVWLHSAMVSRRGCPRLSFAISDGVNCKGSGGMMGRQSKGLCNAAQRRGLWTQKSKKVCRVQAFPFPGRTADASQPVNGAKETSNGKLPPQHKGATLSEQSADVDEIAAKVAAIELQEAAMVRELNHFASLVKETSRAVSERANETRIEMAKLRKSVQLQQQEEFRRLEDVRRQAEEKIEDDYRRVEELRKADDDRRASARLSGLSLDANEVGVSQTGVVTNQVLDAGSGLETGLGTRENGREVDAAGLERGLEFGAANEGAGVLGPDVIAVPEKYECVVAHPGALCCTKTFIRKDPVRRTAVIDIQTTVQCTGDALSSAATLSLDSDDFVALGVHSLAEAAADLNKSRVAQLVQASPDVAEKHRGILDVLTTGKIVSARPMEPPSNFGHESFVVELLDKRTGKQVTALFKPKVEGNADGWHRAPVELIAYELNLMLGMDYVPPVAYRRSGIDVDYRHYDEGAFIYFVPKTKALKKVPAATWGVSVARLLSDTRVMDVLLNNSDRHSGHFLYGEHWADAKMRPVLIDHAAGFRKEAVVLMEHENAFQTGSVRCVSAKTYLRLRFLERSQLVDKFSDVLSGKEIDGLIQRRDSVLEYLDKLVAERGYHRTVIE